MGQACLHAGRQFACVQADVCACMQSDCVLTCMQKNCLYVGKRACMLIHAYAQAAVRLHAGKRACTPHTLVTHKSSSSLAHVNTCRHHEALPDNLNTIHQQAMILHRAAAPHCSKHRAHDCVPAHNRLHARACPLFATYALHAATQSRAACAHAFLRAQTMSQVFAFGFNQAGVLRSASWRLSTGPRESSTMSLFLERVRASPCVHAMGLALPSSSSSSPSPSSPSSSSSSSFFPLQPIMATLMLLPPPSPSSPSFSLATLLCSSHPFGQRVCPLPALHQRGVMHADHVLAQAGRCTFPCADSPYIATGPAFADCPALRTFCT